MILTAMNEVRYIRGRKVIFESAPPREHRYTLDVVDARDNFIETLGGFDDLTPALDAFERAVARRPRASICLRQGCRVIRSSDRPPG